MKTKVMASLFLGLFLVVTWDGAGAQENANSSSAQEILWLEAWGDNTYRDTNFGMENPFWAPDYKEEDFYVSLVTIKAGARLPLFKNIYLDPYLKFEITGDWGDDTWNDAYWNNNEKWGPGVRLRYETNSGERGPDKCFWNINLDLFSEYLMMEDAFDGSKDEIPDLVPKHNFRAGVGSWFSVDSKAVLNDVVSLWAEMWGELAYESTNFYEKEKKDYFILTFQPKLGVKIRISEVVSLQPYFGADFKTDFGSETWNKKPWLNNTQYGPGVRLAFGNIKGLKNANIYLYCEELSVDYLSRVDEMEYRHLADGDTRIGIEFWCPFGATRDSVYRQ